MTYHVRSHKVAVSKIVSIQPMMGRNQSLMSPDTGLVLMLADDSKHQWLCEKDGIVPSAGDFLVTDKELRVIYIVPANKFSTLFQETQS